MGAPAQPPPEDLRHLFPGDSEMAARMRAFDWAASPLGPPAAWPQSLRSALGICLTARFPAQVWWGPGQTLLYNDACIRLLGPGLHPAALGGPARRVWAAVWDTLGPLAEQVLSGGAGGCEDTPLPIERGPLREQALVTCCFSPLFGAGQTVEGLYCACAETAGPAGGAPGSSAGPARILLVDDQADTRVYLSRLLAREHEVIAVADGQEALAAARAQAPDMVLSDVMMPRMDGYSLLRALRADPRTSALPVILLSARAGESDRVEGIEQGADDYLIKPFSPRELLARVRTHLELARVRSAAAEALRLSNEALERRVHERTRALEQANAALRASEERLQKAISIETVGVIFFDFEGRINGANEAFQRMSGYAREQVERGLVRWDTLTPPEFMDLTRRSQHELRARGQNTPYEKQYIRPDGSRWWGLSAGKRLSAHECVEFVLDITERKRAEAARRESEERFRLLIEGARDYAMFLLDPDNRITFWSRGAERVFGWSEAETRGQSGAIIFTPEDRARGAVEHELRTALAEGRAPDQRWHLARSGARLFLDGVLIRLDDERGRPRGFVKIGRDATAQRQAEEAVRRARDGLEVRVQERTADLAAANRALQQEIAERRQIEAERAALMERIITAQEDERRRVARELHDSLGQFLTALTVRLAALHVLAVSPAVRAGLADLLRVAGQIDSELDRLTVELRPPALDDIGLAEALASYAQEWSATSGVPVDLITLKLDGQRLPAAVETTVYRIVQEALTNVLKHAQASQVSVILERRSDTLRAIVEDNGRGFDPDAVARGRGGGRRLGLVGMSERAALAGGTLTVESAPGDGTSVYLSVPLAGEHPAARPN